MSNSIDQTQMPHSLVPDLSLLVHCLLWPVYPNSLGKCGLSYKEIEFSVRNKNRL